MQVTFSPLALGQMAFIRGEEKQKAKIECLTRRRENKKTNKMNHNKKKMTDRSKRGKIIKQRHTKTEPSVEKMLYLRGETVFVRTSHDQKQLIQKDASFLVTVEVYLLTARLFFLRLFAWSVLLTVRSFLLTVRFFLLTVPLP